MTKLVYINTDSEIIPPGFDTTYTAAKLNKVLSESQAPDDTPVCLLVEFDKQYQYGVNTFSVEDTLVLHGGKGAMVVGELKSLVCGLADDLPVVLNIEGYFDVMREFIDGATVSKNGGKSHRVYDRIILMGLERFCPEYERANGVDRW